VNNEYLIRHYKVYAHLHYSICKALGIKTTDIWYILTPTPVREHEDVTANRPDVIIKNKRNTHTDRNVLQKEGEKKLKYIEFIYRVSQEECARLREGVPYVKVYRYN